MTSKTNELRDKLRGAVMSEPGVWFDVSYKLKWDAGKEDFDFENIQQVKSTNKSEDAQ